MKKRGVILLILILLQVFTVFGFAFAKDGGNGDGPIDEGYPIETEALTEVPTQPTQAPTQPTQAPGEPTEAPTQLPVDPTTQPTNPTSVPTSLPTQPDSGANPACVSTRQHWALAELAARYHVEYELLLHHFCDLNFKISEIALGLATVKTLDNTITLEDLLQIRAASGLSWKDLWNRLGVFDDGIFGLLRSRIHSQNWLINMRRPNFLLYYFNVLMRK